MPIVTSLSQKRARITPQNVHVICDILGFSNGGIYEESQQVHLAMRSGVYSRVCVRCVGLVLRAAGEAESLRLRNDDVVWRRGGCYVRGDSVPPGPTTGRLTLR